MERKIICLVALLLIPTLAFAETIQLKSGKTVEGKIVERTDKYIKVAIVGVEVTYFRDEIDSINGQKQEKQSFVTQAMTEAAITKKELVEKIKQAKKAIKRIKAKKENTVNMDIMFMKGVATSDIDFEERIIQITSLKEDFKFNKEVIRSNLMKVYIANARRKGATENKITENLSEMEKVVEKEISSLDDSLNVPKAFCTPLVFIDNNIVYSKVNDYWFKKQLVFADTIWSALSLTETNYDQNAISTLPIDELDKLNTSILLVLEDEQDIINIKEGHFRNQPCYIVERNAEIVTRKFKKILDFMCGLYRTPFAPTFESRIHSLSMYEFISMQDFLPLGIELEFSFIHTLPPAPPINGSLKQKVSFDYPEGSLSVPTTVLDQSKPIENEQDLIFMRKTMQESLKKILNSK